jgi:methyltransferase family protein
VRDDLSLETEKLTHSWAQHEAAWLRDYLVAGVEDPRLNAQSILTRHFLIQALVEESFERLMVEEQRFGAALRWLAGQTDLIEHSESRAAVLHALRQGADNAEGMEIPAFILRTFSGLPIKDANFTVPNYLEDFLSGQSAVVENGLPRIIDTFAEIWSEVLPRTGRSPGSQNSRFLNVQNAGPNNARMSLIEPACGSANDYRFLHSYGITLPLNYFGFDLCRANIENARELFPQAHFETGNVFEIASPDKSFDLCVIHDLFEHLSLIGLEQAIQEVCRVTRLAICVGFFQMDEIAEPVVRPRDDYYWNLLSMEQTRRLFARSGFVAQAIHIDSFLAQQIGAPPAHNPQAYTFILRAG